ncbi:MBL fold metallo-hydrolase [Sporomusa aerivorans]|uniref:MBL fold metallo-hydrolase n=1 Tax=Sporomusa aerivorans TaxID=204936 RepID=UPI00352A92B1
MKLRHVRHATFHLYIHDLVLLVDPVLGPAESMTPIDNSPNQRRNPLVDLPVELAEVVKADCCLVTHMHRDHFDSAAGEQLPKAMPVFCQPEDSDKLKQQGFANVQAVISNVSWQGISIVRTGGQHGTGEIGRKMAPVSGYVLKSAGEPTIYIAGDTIWCPEVAETLAIHRPDVIILFGGAARFNQGEPITMGTEDIVQVCRQAPSANLVVVHMEAINHCLLTRDELKRFLYQEGLDSRVHVPADGQWLNFC